MLPADAKIISTDDHIVEPANLWESRLPARLREAGPRIVEIGADALVQAPLPVGAFVSQQTGHRQVWVWEDRMYPTVGLSAVAGREPKEYGIDPVRFDQMRPGCYDINARIEDMDEDGVWAQLNFPTFPRFSGTLFLESNDWELGRLCIEAWNDFVLDEWCTAAPGRMIPQVLVPLWDPALAAAEIQRTAARGARGVSFPENTYTHGLPSFHSDHWDPFWAACQDADMAISMHFGSSGSVPKTGDDMPAPVMISTMAVNSITCLADLTFSQVFHKFPNLRISLAEGGTGWMPYMLERMDYTWERHRWWTGVNFDARPSDLFRKHVWGCFIDDEAGISQRHVIGLDRQTFESDYPHSDSPWPHSRKRLAEALAGVPDDEALMIAETNARTLFRWDG